MYFQNRTINMSEPPAAQHSSMAANLSGVGGNGCGAFDELELDDPTWNGTFGAISNMAWLREVVYFSADTNETSAHLATEYARKTYFPNGLSPRVPGLGQIGAAMRDSENLYNATAGAPMQVSSVTGYGDVERLLQAVQNGSSAQWITHWNNGAAAPAAGDGPAWWVDVDGRFGRFVPAAGISFVQEGAVPGTSAWDCVLWAQDAGGVLHDVLRVDSTRGLLNAQQIATLAASGGVAFQTYTSAEIDLTGTPTAVCAPAVPGKSWLHFSSLLEITQSDGVLTTGATITLPCGTSQLITASANTPTNADVTGSAAPFRKAFGAGLTYSLQPNTAANVTVTVAATGTTLLKGKVTLIGLYV